MIGIQVIAIFFSLGALYFSYVHYRKKDFTPLETLGWMVVWLLFLIVALFPRTFSPYVQTLGFSRLMDFVVMIAFMVGFMLLLHSYLVVHKLERRLEDLVRKIALNDLPSESKDRKEKH